MGSLKLTTASSGSVILSPANTASDVTITVPAVTGTMLTTASTFAGTGPAFSAYNSVSQTLTNTTWTKVAANIELFDTNSNYDNTTNYRFTPSVAGYYQINAGVRTTASSSILLATAGIYKNGSLVYENPVPPFSTTFTSSNISTIIYLNGSTDYIELYAFCWGSGTLTLDSNGAQTYINAAMVRAA